MKASHFVADLLLFLLMVILFYDGIYKIAYWSNYANWLHRAPLLKPLWVPLTYIIPLGEIGLAFSLLISKLRIRSLYIVIITQILYVLWIAFSHALSDQIYWPFHDLLWKHPLWTQKAYISLVLVWTAFICNLLLDTNLAEPVTHILKKSRYFNFEKK
jgi:hypothetical protein